MAHTPQKRKLARIWLLTLASMLMLSGFMAYWLKAQYEEETYNFKRSVRMEFESVQRRISDSSVMRQVLSHISTSAKGIVGANVKLRVEINDSSFESIQGNTHRQMKTVVSSDQHKNIKIVEMRERDSLLFSKDSLNLDNEAHVLNMVLSKLKIIADSAKNGISAKDTTLFNKAFKEAMQRNEWSFNTQWISSYVTPGDNYKRFYLESIFLRGMYMEVNNFRWMLFRKVAPQLAFSLTLLLLTLIAFRLTYRNLKRQITLSTMKDDFISNMSHELKTPVSTVKVALEALSNFNVMDDRTKSMEYLEMARLEMNRLDMLVNQALQTSMLEEGRLFMSLRQEKLDQITDEVALLMKLPLAEKDSTLSISKEGNDFSISGDRLHLQGVLVNIIDNSLKYAQSASAIQLRLKEEDQSIVLTIEDNGPGIPEAYLEKIFEKFFRVPTGNEHKVKGYGLGLSYVAAVIQQHQGTIKANNIQGGGIRFTITFPKASA